MFLNWFRLICQMDEVVNTKPKIRSSMLSLGMCAPSLFANEFYQLNPHVLILSFISPLASGLGIRALMLISKPANFKAFFTVCRALPF